MIKLDPDIVALQDAFLDKNRRRNRWIVMENDDGYYEVHVHTEDGVAPPSVYPSKRLAVARLMQLLGVGPVAPQMTPEAVEVGNVEIEGLPQ